MSNNFLLSLDEFASSIFDQMKLTPTHSPDHLLPRGASGKFSVTYQDELWGEIYIDLRGQYNAMPKGEDEESVHDSLLMACWVLYKANTIKPLAAQAVDAGFKVTEIVSENLVRVEIAFGSMADYMGQAELRPSRRGFAVDLEFEAANLALTLEFYEYPNLDTLKRDLDLEMQQLKMLPLNWVTALGADNVVGKYDSFHPSGLEVRCSPTRRDYYFRVGEWSLRADTLRDLAQQIMKWATVTQNQAITFIKRMDGEE